jgi:transcription termination factor NusA
LKGLTSLPGIGPKKAEAILKFAEELKEASLSIEEAATTGEETGEEPEKADSQGPEEAESDLTDDGEEDGDEQEIPVDQLSEINSSIIELLMKSGFETLAELSVTRIEELTEIEGIDEETAVTVIEATKKQMENMDSV